MNNIGQAARRIDAGFVKQSIFILVSLSFLVAGSPARADDLFSKTALSCHFDHGGNWDYDVSPPRLTSVKPWHAEIKKIDLKRGSAALKNSSLSVRKNSRSLYFHNFWKLGAPAVISVYGFSVLGGFPAVAQAGFLQVAGHCK